MKLLLPSQADGDTLDWSVLGRLSRFDKNARLRACHSDAHLQLIEFNFNSLTRALQDLAHQVWEGFATLAIHGKSCIIIESNLREAGVKVWRVNCSPRVSLGPARQP